LFGKTHGDRIARRKSAITTKKGVQDASISLIFGKRKNTPCKSNFMHEKKYSLNVLLP
jgi:hypothetical protein